jgi:hypothetical protein
VTTHEQVRHLLPAQRGELDPAEARMLTEHLSRCPVCAAEAAGYNRLAGALAAMRELELEPPAEILDALLARALRRRTDRRLVAAAAGSAGALVATAVVAGVLQHRRRRVRKTGVAIVEPRRKVAMTTVRGRLRRLPEPARLLAPARRLARVDSMGLVPARAR